MNENLNKYKITPSIVKADQESTITISSSDGIFKFFDDTIYNVQFIPLEESNTPIDHELSLRGFNKARKTYKVRPENGELKLTYLFSGEQEWRIHISSDDYDKHLNPLYKKYSPYWDGLIQAPKWGITLSIFSLKPDLYGKIPKRGDLHIHTYFSDGRESPELVASRYRKAGYDFIAITDHNVFNTSKDAKEKLGFVKGLDILHGEEIHNNYAGYFHMVNIGGNYSVNEIYLNEPERVEMEVKELEKEVDVPQNFDKHHYLNRVWLYREIKKSGGFAIFPHPYWDIGFYHTETPVSKAILKNGLCDAFEVLGGVNPEQNNLQVALYNELKAEGVKISPVGSTDSHSVFNETTGYFKKASTIAFTEDDGILGAISKGLSVAVEHLPEENTRVYGDFRLIKYTHFLLRNYFPGHNELCSVSGTLLNAYINGDIETKPMIEKTEKMIDDFKKDFFGR